MNRTPSATGPAASLLACAAAMALLLLLAWVTVPLTPTAVSLVDRRAALQSAAPATPGVASSVIRLSGSIGENVQLE